MLLRNPWGKALRTHIVDAGLTWAQQVEVVLQTASSCVPRAGDPLRRRAGKWKPLASGFLMRSRSGRPVATPAQQVEATCKRVPHAFPERKPRRHAGQQVEATCKRVPHALRGRETRRHAGQQGEA